MENDLRAKRGHFQQMEQRGFTEVVREPKPEELGLISTIRETGETFPAEGTLQSMSGPRMD